MPDSSSVCTFHTKQWDGAQLDAGKRWGSRKLGLTCPYSCHTRPEQPPLARLCERCL